MNITAIGGTVVGNRRPFTQVSGTTATSGDQTLIAAPGAGKRIVVKELVVQNASADATTVLLKNGSTESWRAVLEQYAAISLSFATGEEWRLTANSALVLNLSAANTHGYSVRYEIEST